MMEKFMDSYMILILSLPLLILPFLYMLSRRVRYYVKMTLYSLCIILSGFLAIPVCIPSYFQRKGGIWALRIVDTTTFWLGMNIEVRGKEILDSIEGPAVVVANHQSMLDVKVMSKCWPDRCAVMMKSSLKWLPGFNLAVILCNSIFVSRFNKEKSHLAVEQAVATLQEKGLKLWIFPEGTRYREEGMLPFKKGAFNIAVHAQIPIIPIVISNYSSFYSHPKKYFRTPGYVVVQVMDPIKTKGMTLDDVPELTENVRNQMLEVYKKVSSD